MKGALNCIDPVFYRYTYIVNIFGGIKDGPEGCPKTSAVCRKSKLGDEVLALAPVSSQKVSGKFSGGFFIQYIISCRQERFLAVSSRSKPTTHALCRGVVLGLTSLPHEGNARLYNLL